MTDDDHKSKRLNRGRYNELTLEEKIEVIRYAEHNGERATARKFNIGKTTVNNLKKRRNELFKRFEEQGSSAPSGSIRCTRNSDINRLTYNWFLRLKTNNTRITKQALQNVAREFARRLNIEFKASNHWLELFLKRNDITTNSLSSTSEIIGDCSSGNNSTSNWPTINNDTVINEMHSQFLQLSEGYHPEDIFNAAECVLFYRLTPEQMSSIEDIHCPNGELADERLTVLLATSMTGDRLKPLVIGSTPKPQSFQNVSENDLPVMWRADQRSWMTCEVFVEWLKIVNREMVKAKRHILLFIDDSPVHPKLHDFSNISLKFLPANTITAVQPLDMGLITAFKTYYRKFMLSYVLVYPIEQIENSPFVFSNAVNELDAVYWIERAWRAVDPLLIQRCFKMADFKFIKPEAESDSDDGIMAMNDENAILGFPELPTLGTCGYDVNEYIGCDQETTYCCSARSETDIFEDVLSELIQSEDPLDVSDDLLTMTSEPFPDSLMQQAELTNEQISRMLDTIIHSAAINCPTIVPLISQARTEVNQLICDKQKETIDTSLDLFFN